MYVLVHCWSKRFAGYRGKAQMCYDQHQSFPQGCTMGKNIADGSLQSDNVSVLPSPVSGCLMLKASNVSLSKSVPVWQISSHPPWLVPAARMFLSSTTVQFLSVPPVSLGQLSFSAVVTDLQLLSLAASQISSQTNTLLLLIKNISSTNRRTISQYNMVFIQI